MCHAFTLPDVVEPVASASEAHEHPRVLVLLKLLKPRSNSEAKVLEAEDFSSPGVQDMSRTTPSLSVGST